MNRTLLALTAAVLTAAIAHTATADCSIAYPMQQKKYWPTTSNFVPAQGDHRCDFAGSAHDCQLSGWLVTPNDTSRGNLDAVIYVDDGFRNADRHHACEIVNAMVARGFVVFYAEQRGQWDYSAGIYHFHNTGYFTYDWAAIVEASQPGWYQRAAADYLGDQAKDLDAAIAMLEGMKVGSTSTPLVDSRHVTIMGREDGAITAMASPAQVSHHVAATVDLGGGSRHWQSSSYWSPAIAGDVAGDSAPLFIQEVANESPDGSFWSSIQAFDDAFASDAAESDKLAFYAAFNPPADEQTVCDDSDWDDVMCGNYWFVNDHDKVARWWPILYDWLYRVGAT